MTGAALFVTETLVPSSRQCTLEVFLLGCRSLAPFHFRDPHSPFVELMLDLGSTEVRSPLGLS